MCVYVHVRVSVSLQPPPEMIKTVKKTASLHRSTTKKRLSGPGSYQVVQCGTAGHNIRSKPSMRGTPVGRLNKNNIIEAIEEVKMYITYSIHVHVHLLGTCILTHCSLVHSVIDYIAHVLITGNCLG